jgi:hypothetical protein
MASGQKKDDSFGSMVMVIILAVLALLIFFWFVAGKGIVLGTSGILYSLSSIWDYVPGGQKIRMELHRAGSLFLQRGGDVPFQASMTYVNSSLKPWAVMFCVFWGGTLALVIFSPRISVLRRFNSDVLLKELSVKFTGTIPIHHLRKDLVADKDPLWARQTAPEDVFQEFRGQGGRPMLKGRDLDVEAAAQYFRGNLAPVDGRMNSKMLGRQVVDMMTDPANVEGICFPDRMSDLGKVVFGIFCARAFGGPQGVKDARQAMDQLNRSCAGAAHGLPNIRVAQWIYEKYRLNDAAKHLFQVHHWEYTYLYALFYKAKEPGKITLPEMLWLKPANRILFYALNTVGSLVPSMESAAVFNQHAYERMCAKHRRMPVLKNSRGEFVHVLYCEDAVEGLESYAAHWVAGGDEPEDPWLTDKEIWKRSAKLLNEHDRENVKVYDLLPQEAGPESDFDKAQKAIRIKSEQDANAALLNEITDEIGQ